MRSMVSAHSNERGGALVLYAILLSLLGMAAMGYFLSSASLGRNVPLGQEYDIAQAAASAGVQATAQYYAQIANADQGTWTPTLAETTSGTGSLPANALTAAITASVVSDTLAPATVGVGFQGNIVVNSTGSFGRAAATNQSILQGQFNQLNSGKANFVLTGAATNNGQVKVGQPAIYVATTKDNQKNVTFNGNTVVFLPLSQFPKIVPQNLKNVATMQLLLVNGVPTVDIPANDLPLYTQFLAGTTANGSGISCVLVANSANACPSGLANQVSYGGNGWTINADGFPGFYYVDGNVTVQSSQKSAVDQITVAATGTINTYAKGTSGNNATFLPFDDVTDTNLGSVNYCAQYAPDVLSPCQSANGTVVPIPQLEGLSFISSGDITTGGDNFTIQGDLETAGTLNLDGGGNKSFGGVMVAQNGLTYEGGITLTTPNQAAQQTTTGAIVFPVIGTRWMTPQ
ncbi:hypothetical protein ACSSZE_12430 [Acidithiobacillus caldus]